MRANDDVVCEEFFQGIIFLTAVKQSIEIVVPQEELRQLGIDWTYICDSSQALQLRPGPHRILGDKLAPIYRIFDDTNGAFLHSLFATPPRYCHTIEVSEIITNITVISNPKDIPIRGSVIQTVGIAVPSRMAHARDCNTLSGVRIAVKDIFKIRNVRTSVCNKAYYELYPPASETAECIKLLSQAGAVILGTTKLASFAATEEPVECIDYQAPWNPRADGYQSPAGSSSGSGVAVAAYSWVDIAIGSDSMLQYLQFISKLTL